MFFSGLLSSDPYASYYNVCSDVVFDDVFKLVEHIVDSYVSTSLNDEDKWDHLEFRAQLVAIYDRIDPTKERLFVPFIFNKRREVMIGLWRNHFLLDEVQTNNLRSLVFNYVVKNFIEHKFFHKFVKTAIGHIEKVSDGYNQYFNKIEENFDSWIKSMEGNDSLIEDLRISHKEQVTIEKNAFSKKLQLEKLLDEDQIPLLKKELFPELFSKGRPKTIAFDEFLIGLYDIISSRGDYMPFIQRIITDLTIINPDYFSKVECNDNALRKKIKVLKKIKSDP